MNEFFSIVARNRMGAEVVKKKSGVSQIWTAIYRCTERAPAPCVFFQGAVRS